MTNLDRGSFLSAFAKEELIHALQKSVMELQQGIDLHTRLIATILEKEGDGLHFKPPVNGCPSRNREFRMKEAIKEAIDVLEESRKAFKSKRLEILRKRLTEVLIQSE